MMELVNWGVILLTSMYSFQQAKVTEAFIPSHMVVLQELITFQNTHGLVSGAQRKHQEPQNFISITERPNTVGGGGGGGGGGVGRFNTNLFALLRPSWLRRASRIKRIQEEKNKKVLKSLKSRQNELGIGKLYLCQNPSIPYPSSTDYENVSIDGTTTHDTTLTVKWKEKLLNVYLNIPENEYEANDKTNIIHQLKSGDIVKATAPNEGIWIEHDMGGWSPSTVDGMTRLKEIDT